MNKHDFNKWVLNSENKMIIDKLKIKLAYFKYLI